jgi:hypothetical protein
MDRQVGRLFALENPADIAAIAPFLGPRLGF